MGLIDDIRIDIGDDDGVVPSGVDIESRTISILDGVTAPDAVAGFAKIYVDSADGDLKIRFSDGTIKTIMTDT